MTRRCADCSARPLYREVRCADHVDDERLEPGDVAGPVRRTELRLDFSVICLLCSERRSARGTEAQAAYTRQHLGPCRRCLGPLVVERADLGAISSPVAVRPVRFGRVG